MNYIEMDEIRNRLGWSKRELAKRIGVGDKTIYAYYRNKSNIPEPVAKLMQMLAEKAGV